MSWVKDALSQLKENEVCKIRPIGGSMRGRIESGQLVTIRKFNDELKVDDIVFLRWKNNYLIHIVSKIDEDNIEISNNLGKINGWAKKSDILGIVINIEE